jgi:3-hydroxybutyryl-CoA dehydrogenase
MALDWSRDDATVAVIGAGAMGRGIAQVAAQGGLKVLLFDAASGAAEKARAYIAEMLDGAAKKGRLAPAEAEAAVGRLNVVGTLEELAPADAVIEAIVEALDVKRDLFRKLEAIVRPDTVIASNTSSIRIASIAAACSNKARIAGMHFFNPVPLMKLVEVIRAPATAPEVVDALTALGKRMGRVPVTVSDSPGFLVNLGNRPFSTEAVRLAMEGVATPAEIDAILRDAVGFRMGPFELMDLTGLDVNFPAAKIMYEGYFHDRRLATWPLHQAMAESGQLGRKSGRGWYAYEDGKLVPQPTDAPIDAAPAAKLVMAERDEALEKLLARRRREPDRRRAAWRRCLDLRVAAWARGQSSCLRRSQRQHRQADHGDACARRRSGCRRCGGRTPR